MILKLWCTISTIIVLAVLAVAFLACIYACCVVSGREDRWLEREEAKKWQNK